jgi:hypothetical protein
MVTFTVQCYIRHRTDDEYEQKLDRLEAELMRFGTVDIESEDDDNLVMG